MPAQLLVCDMGCVCNEAGPAFRRPLSSALLPGHAPTHCCFALPPSRLPPMQTHPDFRQAAFLKGEVDDIILKEGLVGVGIGAAVVGVGLALLFGGSKR